MESGNEAKGVESGNEASTEALQNALHFALIDRITRYRSEAQRLQCPSVEA